MRVILQYSVNQAFSYSVVSGLFPQQQIGLMGKLCRCLYSRQSLNSQQNLKITLMSKMCVSEVDIFRGLIHLIGSFLNLEGDLVVRSET